RGRGLAHLLDLDQALPAIRGDREFLVIAEARNRNAGRIRGLDDHRALRRADALAVDLELDQVGRGFVFWLRAHATIPSSSRRKPGSMLMFVNPENGFRLSPE